MCSHLHKKVSSRPSWAELRQTVRDVRSQVVVNHHRYLNSFEHHLHHLNNFEHHLHHLNSFEHHLHHLNIVDAPPHSGCAHHRCQAEVSAPLLVSRSEELAAGTGSISSVNQVAFHVDLYVVLVVVVDLFS